MGAPETIKEIHLAIWQRGPNDWCIGTMVGGATTWAPLGFATKDEAERQAVDIRRQYERLRGRVVAFPEDEA